MRVSILTVSDSVARGKHEDASGPAVAGRCRELGWEIVSAAVLPDERGAIAELLRKTADAKLVDLILTTGGTGVGPRDVTPEATIGGAVDSWIRGADARRRFEKNAARDFVAWGCGNSRDYDDCEFAGKSARGCGIAGCYRRFASSCRGCAARRTPLIHTQKTNRGIA
jgi:molybdenum cofactor synthesis domain-containing protein